MEIAQRRGVGGGGGTGGLGGWWGRSGDDKAEWDGMGR